MTYSPHPDDVAAAPHLADCDKAREQGLPCGCITRDVLAAVGSAIEARALRQAADDITGFANDAPPTASVSEWHAAAEYLDRRAGEVSS